MKLYLCHKTVLRFYPKAAAFLNGYTTNAVEASRTAFVDIRANVLAVAEQYKLSGDEVWEVVETSAVEKLLAHLRKYLAVSDTAVEKLPSKRVYCDLATGKLVFSDEELPAAAGEEEYTRFRVKKGIPLDGVDFGEEMVLNLAQEDLVSFTKGCYLGQEIVARVHHRSKPPKRLVVKSEAECTPEQLAQMTSRVKDAESGKTLGFVFDKT